MQIASSDLQRVLHLSWFLKIEVGLFGDFQIGCCSLCAPVHNSTFHQAYRILNLEKEKQFKTFKWCVFFRANFFPHTGLFFSLRYDSQCLPLAIYSIYSRYISKSSNLSFYSYVPLTTLSCIKANGLGGSLATQLYFIYIFS